MARRLLTLLASFYVLYLTWRLPEAASFAVNPILRQNCLDSRSRRHRRFYGTREDEIAKLEEQIRQLRAEQEMSSVTAKEQESADAQVQKLVAEKRVLERVSGKDLLITEGTLISENLMETESAGGGNIIVTALAVVAAAVFLFFFSQVPIGQDDFSKYSATGSAGTVTKTIDLGDLNPDKSSATAGSL